MAEATETPAATTTSRGRPKTRVGIVTSNKMQKTVVVTVQRRAPHRKYGKILSLREKYKAHVEDHVAVLRNAVLVAKGGQKQRHAPGGIRR